MNEIEREKRKEMHTWEVRFCKVRWTGRAGGRGNRTWGRTRGGDERTPAGCRCIYYWSLTVVGCTNQIIYITLLCFSFLLLLPFTKLSLLQLFHSLTPLLPFFYFDQTTTPHHTPFTSIYFFISSPSSPIFHTKPPSNYLKEPKTSS